MWENIDDILERTHEHHKKIKTYKYVSTYTC
jgi:hypothetical protein